MAGLLDFLQSANNTAASTVSAPVDGLAWLLRKAGVPVPAAPVGSSAWLDQQGLTRPVQQSAASLAGEAAGLLSPALLAAKAPQVARGLLQAAENMQAPTSIRGMSASQRGIVPGKWERSYHTTTSAPFDPPSFDLGMSGSASGHASAEQQGMWASASPRVSNIFGFDKVTDLYPTKVFGPAGAGVQSVGLNGVLDGANTMPLRTRVMNPKIVSAKDGQEMVFGKPGEDWRSAGETFAEFVRKAKEDGFDSVVIKGNPMARHLEFRADQVLMFDPKNQAKSLFSKP